MIRIPASHALDEESQRSATREQVGIQTAIRLGTRSAPELCPSLRMPQQISGCAGLAHVGRIPNLVTYDRRRIVTSVWQSRRASTFD